jgi:hypothetical protein
VGGSRKKFLWSDTDGANHLVRLSGWTYRQTQPSWWIVEINMEEIL